MSPPPRPQYASPLHIDRLDASGTALSMERIRFEKKDAAENSHDERWLQNLIFSFPQALPVSEIDSGLDTLVPICLEMPLQAGYVDNLYVTEDGDIVVAECKLWRNPEARREVVAQIIDYAHAMASWTYEELDQAVRKGILPDGSRIKNSLYEIVSLRADIDEAAFVDAISRNLRLGRLLLLVVGDGIREGAETLGQYLQMHAGFHFTLAMVEIPVFRSPTGGVVVTPRLLARTVNIERGIVRVVDGRAVVEKAPEADRAVTPRGGLTQDRIIESITSIQPRFADSLRTFAAAAEEHGLFLAPATKSLMVRFQGPDDSPFTAGGFGVDGAFVTYSVNWRPAALGLVHISHQYLESVAALLDGSVRKTATPQQWYVVAKDGKSPSAMDILGRSESWLPLIVEFHQRLREAMEERVG